MTANFDIERRGLLLIVSSPSGAGKTTLTRLLLEKEEKVSLSISVTTRQRRSSEVEGVHYYFVSQRRFEQMRERNELLEWAEVHGNFYGTPREPVEAALNEGRDVLFDIDWQGTLQLYETMRSDVVSVFVLPPTADELKARLERRAEDNPEIIARRLKNAADEIPHWKEYDYVLVNRDLEDSLTRLRSILTAERLKRVREDSIQAFVDPLLSDLRKLTPR
ncbi:guanylate kinase [Pseudorhodoplanes sp.]|uniref:guanylate kinase n=1 Tax=Pseudorhodoplanes sp. TaxID=1934341 RepID=UPI002CCBAB79|nr:guanylate kinase [Pseudorhodoplanes sp.]HWV43062.1 guanylate kinase [Pseudorhodoplanes sp.]